MSRLIAYIHVGVRGYDEEVYLNGHDEVRGLSGNNGFEDALIVPPAHK